MLHDGTSSITELSTIDAVTFLLSGFCVVMLTLALLWAATVLIGFILKKLGLNKMPAPAPRVNSKPSAIPAEVIAVITAAVSFATGGQANIKEIAKKS